MGCFESHSVLQFQVYTNANKPHIFNRIRQWKINIFLKEHMTLIISWQVSGLWIWATTTGDPRISWFHNSWSLLFRDIVSGLNFLNSPPFHDFEKKKSKIFFYFFGKLFWIFFSSFFFVLFIYSDCHLMNINISYF